MTHRITVLPEGTAIDAPHGENLLKLLRSACLAPQAPCGGSGTCKKCKIIVDGVEQLACQTVADRDMTVAFPETGKVNVLSDGCDAKITADPIAPGYQIAVDIGTTTVVCFLLSKLGETLATASCLNPQTVYGADVISRIRLALNGEMENLTNCIRTALDRLTREVCEKAQIDPKEVGVCSVVANTCMQQLFLGISPKNLAEIPFAPVLTQAKTIPCREYLPVCPNALLLIVPDISGYIGADTMGCVLSTEMYKTEDTVLMVDIGTNGEMVMGNKDRMIACSTAAGPALEGANIQFGMRGAPGAIDHVWLEDGKVHCSVIGGKKAEGICGSGLIDAVAVGLEMGLLNRRGRILNEERIFYLTEEVWLTQEDIRQVQLAKGAIHAGIALMAMQLGIRVCDIDRVLLAGAFGSFLNPRSACRIGLIPEELEPKITAVGNAAGSGAKILASNRHALDLSQSLVEKIEFLELASLPEFSKTFAKSTNFRE